MTLAEMLEPLTEQHQTVLILMGGSVLVVLVLAAVLLIKTSRSSLNWYEQNVLDISVAPQHVRCRSFNRWDTEDETKSVDDYPRSTGNQSRKQSRLAASRAAVTQRLLPPPADLAFHIPKMPSSSRSMFTNPQQREFDRGLYQLQDESVCSEEMGCSGSIQLALSLDPNLGLLTVTLRQAIDLPSRRQDDEPNPYFRVALDVPEGARQEYQTKSARSTSSPVIEETFCFQVPAALIASCRLEITVFDFDQFSVDECVGYCFLTLGRLSVSLEKDNPTVFWAEALPFDDSGGKGFGQVLFSLAYLSHAQRLTMNVFKARNLPCRAEGSVSFRVTLVDGNERRLKKKKTASKRTTRNLQFNESLTFNVAKHSLCDVFLEIEAVHETGTFGMTTEVIGRMELPLHKCKDLWRAIIREEKAQARWYPLDEP